MRGDTRTAAELLAAVESDTSLTTTRDKALALVRMVPERSWPAALMHVTMILLEVRARRGMIARPAPQAMTASAAAGGSALPVPAAKRVAAPPVPATKGARRYGSARVAAAALAWRDLIGATVQLQGRPVAVLDMSPPQLRELADAIYDAHERLHDLADRLEREGLSSAAQLPTGELAEITAATS